MVVICWFQRGDLARPVVAVIALLAVLAFTAASTALLGVRRDRLLTWGWTTVDIALGFGLLLADGVAYDRGHTFGVGRTWPATGRCSPRSPPPWRWVPG